MKIQNLDLNLLRTLVTLEKTGSYAAASEQLFKTQSAITQHIQKLEEQIGFKLFNKVGRRNQLTAQAKELVKYSERLLALNDEIIRNFSERPMEGLIRFGATLDIADSILPTMLSYIATQAPKVKLEIEVNRSPQLIEMLNRGLIDLTISSRFVKELESFIVRQSPVVWLSAAGYFYDRYSPVPLVLSDEPSVFRRMALETLEQYQIPWNINYLAPSLVAVKAAIKAGLGITARSIETLSTDMRTLGEPDGLPTLPFITYNLHMRRDTVSPLILDTYHLLKEKFDKTPQQLKA